MASFLYIGAQIDVAYSRCGRTRDLNKFRNISLSINVKVLNMSPTIWLAFDTFVLMCSVKVSLLSNMTPKSFSLLTFSMFHLLFPWYMLYLPYYFLHVGGGIFYGDRTFAICLPI